MLAVILLTLAILAVARITRLFTEDRLLLAYRRWVVARWGEDSMAAYLAHCPWCTSIYVATLIMPATVWGTLHTQYPTQPWYVTVGACLLSIPAASHVAGMLNRE